MSSCKNLQKFLSEHAKLARLGSDDVGFDIFLHSSDHPPAHIHLSEDGKTDLCRVVIPERMPRTIDMIVTLEKVNPLSNKQKKDILEWFQKRDEDGSTNFGFAKRLWREYHSDGQV